MKELEGMARQINDHRIKQGAIKEASTAYKQMMRGRYEYLNDFMEEMQVLPSLCPPSGMVDTGMQPRNYPAVAVLCACLVAARATCAARCR